jgi:hypothetical protein
MAVGFFERAGAKRQIITTKAELTHPAQSSTSEGHGVGGFSGSGFKVKVSGFRVRFLWVRVYGVGGLERAPCRSPIGDDFRLWASDFGSRVSDFGFQGLRIMNGGCERYRAVLVRAHGRRFQLSGFGFRMVHGILCMVSGVGCMVYGVWCAVSRVWCMVCGV